jgi:hypothetical protein
VLPSLEAVPCSARTLSASGASVLSEGVSSGGVMEGFHSGRSARGKGRGFGEAAWRDGRRLEDGAKNSQERKSGGAKDSRQEGKEEGGESRKGGGWHDQ